MKVVLQHLDGHLLIGLLYFFSFLLLVCCWWLMMFIIHILAIAPHGIASSDKFGSVGSWLFLSPPFEYLFFLPFSTVMIQLLLSLFKTVSIGRKFTSSCSKHIGINSLSTLYLDTPKKKIRWICHTYETWQTGFPRTEVEFCILITCCMLYYI